MIKRYKAAFRQLIDYLRSYIKETWHPGYYLSVGLFLIVCLCVNYFLREQGTVESWLLRTFRYSEWGIVAYMGFYGLPYYGTMLLYGIFKKDWSWVRNKAFWLRSLFAIFILSFDGAFYYYKYIGDLATAYATRYYLYKVCATFISLVAIGIPIWLFRKWLDKEQEDLYGLRFRGFEYRPYVLMLLFMVPIVAAASFLPDFISYYPTLKIKRLEQLAFPPKGAAIALYEVLYLLDFVWTELIFRGFLVIGMASVLGNESVMPMASVYVSRHFAKPLGESISSFFGGYILGVIALKSRNIMGGVLIHMGIAFLMEIFALMQWFWRTG